MAHSRLLSCSTYASVMATLSQCCVASGELECEINPRIKAQQFPKHSTTPARSPRTHIARRGAAHSCGLFRTSLLTVNGTSPLVSLSEEYVHKALYLHLIHSQSNNGVIQWNEKGWFVIYFKIQLQQYNTFVKCN